MGQKYIDALDQAISFRENTLASLRSEANRLTKQLSGMEAGLEKLAKTVDDQNTKIKQDAATISQVTATAAENLELEWNNRLDAWAVERSSKDKDFDDKLTEHISLLAGSASVGRRLVEHAAGLLTATEWAGRAKRERLNAIWLRWGSMLAFFAALSTGLYILVSTIGRGMQLTVGDGILRGALILTLAGVGTFLSSEARRHFKEADSAEEVTLALAAIEPFYAGAASGERSKARTAVGDTVFVKNILSRFSNRDATKHGSSTNADLAEVMDLLVKGAAVTKTIDSK
ncbi:hypothetical protein [Ruicaihuangia caeni]|uniref:hypothetical protein n=1 Tax=Ruicaihuangia caeni TaxID=3042517 RepID=UPI003390237D